MICYQLLINELFFLLKFPCGGFPFLCGTLLSWNMALGFPLTVNGDPLTFLAEPNPRGSQWKTLLFPVGLLVPPKIATQRKLWFLSSMEDWHVVETSGQTRVMGSSKNMHSGEFGGSSRLDPWGEGGNEMCIGVGWRNMISVNLHVLFVCVSLWFNIILRYFVTRGRHNVIT